MKYVKAGDPAPTPDQLAKIKAEAIDQLDQYSADPALIAEWHIGVAGVPPDVGVAGVSPATGTMGILPVETTGTTGVSPVALHRLVLVFHGGDCILNEEV